MQNYFDNEATSAALHATMKPARGGKCLVTLSTYEDRKEALLNTAIMEDAVTYRSKGQRVSTSQQSRQQDDTVDSREAKQDAQNYIPKPPPLLPLTSSNGAYKNNNNNTNNNPNKQQITTLTTSLATSANKSSPNVNGNNESYSRSNKAEASASGPNTNRQALRLGSVTIGEYRQSTLRREPEKFDFIAGQKKGRDSGDTTPTNEALQSELQTTLSRSNLRKTNGNSYAEHQRNCPLHQQQQQLQQRQSMDFSSNGFTVEEVSKKLQKTNLNDTKNGPEQLLAKMNNRSVNSSIGAGILKNGNRNGTTNSIKSIEKSIKFG